jgi:hypothetical protein
VSTDVAATTATWYGAQAGTGMTTYTIGAVLWEQQIPLTAGANWAEWVTPGSEWTVPNAATVCLYVTASSAPTSVSAVAQIVFSE